MAAATHGWASCRSAARPAPRKMADSREMRHTADRGPKRPARASGQERVSSASWDSRSAVETRGIGLYYRGARDGRQQAVGSWYAGGAAGAARKGLRMHQRVRIVGLCVAMAIVPALAVAQGATSAAQATAAVSPAESFNAVLSAMENQIVPAAEAMPAEKFDFAPPTTFGLFAGVRTFAQQVKHLTEANYSIFRAYGVPGTVDAKTIEALKTKDEIVDALKKSYAYAHAAVSTITVENAFDPIGPPQRRLTRATLAAYGIAHSMDHYGQMVEYLRMNGIVPPASRRP
jgi:uncharacterized damage-inducible protein DinB